MTNFYCEFFHFFFSGSISFFTSRRISSIASAILFSCFVSILYLFLMYPILSFSHCQACSLELEACSFFLFLIFLAKPVYELVCTSLVNLLNRLTINLTPDPIPPLKRVKVINPKHYWIRAQVYLNIPISIK